MYIFIVLQLLTKERKSEIMNKFDLTDSRNIIVDIATNYRLEDPDFELRWKWNFSAGF